MLRLFTSQPAFKLLSDDAEKRGMRAEREVLSNSLHGAAMQIQSRGADMSVSRALCESVLTATERVPAPERQRVLESLAVAMVASLRGHMHSFSSETAQAIYDVMSPSLIPTMAVTKTPPPPLWPMTMRRVVLQTTGPLTAPSTNWVWGWVDSSCFSEKGADFETVFVLATDADKLGALSCSTASDGVFVQLDVHVGQVGDWVPPDSDPPFAGARTPGRNAGPLIYGARGEGVANATGDAGVVH